MSTIESRENRDLSLSLYTDTDTITNTHLIDSAMNFFKELRKAYPGGRPPPLVLALDEVHVMSDRGCSVPGSLLDIFTGVLSDLKATSANWTNIIHFATIFLSTNPELKYVAPPTDQIASQRLPTMFPAGTLTCVPFDVFVEKKKKWTVANISTLKFISTFGRPL